MKKIVKVLIPFHSVATGKNQIPDDIIELTDEQLAAVKAVNVNMVKVIGEDVENSVTVEEIEVVDDESEQVVEKPAPKKRKSKVKTAK